MTVLVFGCSGQLARALARHDGVTTLGRDQVDLADAEAPVRAIEAANPEFVVNAAAYTQVDQAEEDEALATLINGVAPGRMAEACAARDVPLVHVSTDYVFDGAGDQPFAPDAPTAPLNAYGRSKRAGELAVDAAGGAFAILRTSWVFDGTGPNFVTTMLRLGAEQESLRVVADQNGGPTPAAALAEACLTVGDHLLRKPEDAGLYHYSGAPNTSWAGFARAIFQAADLTCRVEEIETADFPRPARRPLNSRLNCDTTEAVFELRRPDWQASLARYLSDRGKGST